MPVRILGSVPLSFEGFSERYSLGHQFTGTAQAQELVFANAEPMSHRSKWLGGTPTFAADEVLIWFCSHGIAVFVQTKSRSVSHTPAQAFCTL